MDIKQFDTFEDETLAYENYTIFYCTTKKDTSAAVWKEITGTDLTDELLGEYDIAPSEFGGIEICLEIEKATGAVQIFTYSPVKGTDDYKESVDPTDIGTLMSEFIHDMMVACEADPKLIEKTDAWLKEDA